MSIVLPPEPHAKPMRSDGAEARARLLDAALALFAEKGFAKTSTRETALAVHVNLASIGRHPAQLCRAHQTRRLDAVVHEAAFPRNARAHRCVARRD